MSLPPQQKVNIDKSGKQRAAAMKEPVQHSGEVYYGMGPPPLELGHSDSGGNSSGYIPEKGPQGRVHYQQGAPVRWMHQDPMQTQGWSQEAPVPTWGQNFGPPYMGGVNSVRGHMVYRKSGHDVGALHMGGESQPAESVEVYRDAAQAHSQARGLEWEQHAAAAAMRQAQLQAYQPGPKGMELQGQPHGPSHAVPGSMLQSFHTAFGPKQQLPSGYFPVFQGGKAMPNQGYSEQPKTQHQLLQQMQQQQQQMHHHPQQQPHQQPLHQQQQQQQQHHHALQQQQHHLQQHQMQQHQIQQQQLQHMQQYHQQQLQDKRQPVHSVQQQQQQRQPHVQQQETSQPHLQQKQQQNQHFLTYQPPERCPSNPSLQKDNILTTVSVRPEQKTEVSASDSSATPDSCPQKSSLDATEPPDAQHVLPRRSRRLSRDGLSPVGGLPAAPWSQASKDPGNVQNGVLGEEASRDVPVTGGVIQSTRRRRRASKEINLETLAQKASEMESLPAKKDEAPAGRSASMVPLVIPVSVPVRGGQMDPSRGSWPEGRLGPCEQVLSQPEHKPSVIVARRRSLRNPNSESFSQEGESYARQDDDGKSKSKRRPRPEPLFIPPPKPATFIAPSVYSSITPYQSHLRSPIRLPDHAFVIPPYTPPPILSPVREGSGLYFSTFLSSIAASSQSLPPPATPKSATRSLLRSTSADLTPPVLPLITDATPVSSEPRINIGQQYQAEIPELRDHQASQFDLHKADLVWLPMREEPKNSLSVDDLMHLACSSVFHGGGTNQELVLHCLHERDGDVLETLNLLMLKEPIFPVGHQLADYHYSGSDRWTAEEKRFFNKGITAYRKDFFMVQKLVRTKTVTQCVEFYYTYKKQVKISRNGVLTFGPPHSPVEKATEAVVDIKSSQQVKLNQGEVGGVNVSVEPSDDHTQDELQARVARTLQIHDYAAPLSIKPEEQDVVKRESRPQSVPPSAPRRPRPADSTGKTTRAPSKPSQDPEGVFPCKKCSRVFNKVKSRSAHMKSHAEQEKKAAALRQKEEEEWAAAAAKAKVREAALAAAAAAAQNGGGATEQTEVSSQEESSEGEDANDEDWR